MDRAQEARTALNNYAESGADDQTTNVLDAFFEGDRRVLAKEIHPAAGNDELDIMTLTTCTACERGAGAIIRA